MIPATLALITAVGPPDCATNKFPAKSAIVFRQNSPDAGKQTASKRPISVQIEPKPCQRRKRLSKGNPYEKLQIPSVQAPKNLKVPITNWAQGLIGPSWRLGLGNWSFSGAWCLEFGASTPPPPDSPTFRCRRC